MATKSALMNMEGREAVSRAVICAIKTRPNMNMDDLILCCRPYTWNQVFLALDDLIRNGLVTLKQGGGFYLVSVSIAHRSRYDDRKMVAQSSSS